MGRRAGEDFEQPTKELIARVKADNIAWYKQALHSQAFATNPLVDDVVRAWSSFFATSDFIIEYFSERNIRKK